MANIIPQWADAQLSNDLSNVRAAGESPTVEFKERSPDPAHRLAQEVAALGTSGGGVLYVGINDNGDLVSVDAPNGDTRDALVERVQGPISTIRPNLRADNSSKTSWMAGAAIQKPWLICNVASTAVDTGREQRAVAITF